MTLGPFEVSAQRVVDLRDRFTFAINKLMAAEVADAGMRASSLSLTDAEDTADGGVDAVISNVPPGHDWFSEGASGLQFKRSNVYPKECASEFRGATFAHEIIKDGGSYVLLLGVDLPRNLLTDRKKAIVTTAIELGLITKDEEHRIEVFGASDLARWISQYPPLAMSRIFDGPGRGALDYESWSATRVHKAEFVPDERREQHIQEIRGVLAGEQVFEIRVQGHSGIGKSRLVLEALRGQDLSPLVLYVPDAEEVTGELLEHAVRGAHRSVILVIDECPAQKHVNLVGRLPDDPRVKLITIGHSGAAAKSPVFELAALGDSAMDSLTRTNFPLLSEEERRFVVAHGDGNPRWAEVLGRRVQDASGDAVAADLIAANDIEQFLTYVLPEGRDFFIASALALFDRVGFDEELAPDLEVLAEFFDTDVDDLHRVAQSLEQAGLLVRRGRYRSVVPQPLAVVLAAAAWETNGEKIVSQLIPQLDDNLALYLFRRLAELGGFESSDGVLQQLLSVNGPFASLESIERDGTMRLLTQLAIALPEPVMRHLGELVELASEQELRDLSGLRRDLVWTLEKLSWHTATFNRAASCLLKLSHTEIESYGNNATGTWLALFKPLLPTTAAAPESRLRYLNTLAASERKEDRLMATAGFSTAIELGSRATFISAELQGGAIVEARGRPETWGEVFAYQESAVRELLLLAEDGELPVATAATDSLIGSIHRLAATPLWNVLEEGLIGLTTAHRLARRELRGLLARYERIGSTSTENDGGDEALVRALKGLQERLPEARGLELLEASMEQNQWEVGAEVLREQVYGAVQAVLEIETSAEVLKLAGRDLPGSLEFGMALARCEVEEETVLAALVAAYEANPRALRGYLIQKVNQRDQAAVDEALLGPHGSSLPPEARLELASISQSESMRALVADLVLLLPVSEVVPRTGYPDSDDDLASLFEGFESRVIDQHDYNSLLRWVSMALHDREEVPVTLVEPLRRLVLSRSSFPDIGRQDWDWGRLASGVAAAHELEIANVILDLVENGLILIGGEQESTVLRRVLFMNTVEVWGEVGRRIEGGSWRVSLGTRRWLLDGVEAESILDWVGDSADRASLVADMAPIGRPAPTKLVQALFAKFQDESAVRSGFYGDLVSGSWVGNESDRIAGQIELLNGWRDDTSIAPEFRRWSGEVVESLLVSKSQAEQREAERDF